MHPLYYGCTCGHWAFSKIPNAHFLTMDRKYNFVLTLNNYTFDEEESIKSLVDMKLFKYFCYGKEVGESGTPHLQCFGRTVTKLSIASLQRKIGEITGFASRYAIKVANASLESNRLYCMKGEQSHEEWEFSKENGPNYGKNAKFFEYGTYGQGKRSDLEKVTDLISSGHCEKDVAEACGESYIKYYKGIRELIAMKHSNTKERESRTIGYWCWGPTRS